MNIFVLSMDPREAARLHADRHVVKMTLETAQILSAAVHRRAPQVHAQVNAYRVTHKHHPCVRWAGDTSSNFLWLCDLGDALAEEHSRRYVPKHEHKSAAVIRRLRACVRVLPQGGRTPFAQAMPDELRGADPVAAYRRYYARDKQVLGGRPASWRAPATRPAWM